MFIKNRGFICTNKSSLMSKIAYYWAVCDSFAQFDLVFHLTMRILLLLSYFYFLSDSKCAAILSIWLPPQIRLLHVCIPKIRGRSSARIRESIRAKIRVKMLWRESRWIQVDSRKTSYQTVKLSVKMIISFVQKDRKFHRVNSLFCF